MKKQLLLYIAFFPLFLFGQHYKITGKVYDNSNPSDFLIGVNVVYAPGMGVITDFEGNYTLKLSPGKYTIQFSYVGFDKESVNIVVTDKDQVLNIGLTTQAIDEVTVVADVARSRKTPVAFSTIQPQIIQENQGNQDIPMLLNKTPGVYATQQGGGDGDASITIRGFSARNVGVLIDGVPVNDMETGQVYWSNWSGLNHVIRSMQVQRGLGASKLALPSVGGTINIITKGLDTKKEGRLKQEIGSDGYLSTSFAYNTGILKNNWAFSVAGSFKTGNGWVDETFTKGYFYYLKVDKKIGRHLISVTGYGAPQSHGQRSYQLPVGVYDSAYAEKVGIKLAQLPGLSREDSIAVSMNRRILDEGIGNGLRYNQHWGYLARITDDNPNAKSERINERVNIYHKPQFTIKDNWTISDNVYVSNIAYLSVGRGGGVSLKTSPLPDIYGHIPIQSIYDKNRAALPNELYDDNLRPSSNFLREAVNEHIWYGILSTIDYKVNSNLKFAGGIDLRSYKSTHEEIVYDLLGGDYFPASDIDYSSVDWTQPNPLKSYMLKEGDRLNYNTNGLVRWGGIFTQAEYTTEKISSFINLTTSINSSNQIYHRIGYADSTTTIGWQNYPGFTAKSGVNYNLTDYFNAFINVGYLSKAPRFNNIVDYNNNLFNNVKNEVIKAAELGGSYNTSNISANVNIYYTIWENRPVDSAPSITLESGVTTRVNVNGLDALHKGIEFDGTWKLSRQLEIKGLFSLGDWRWNSSDTARVYDDNNNLIYKQYFDATGVHVGNSAQTQFGGEIRWEPVKGLYLKPSVTYFGKYFANFEPLSLNGTPSSYEWYNVSTGEHGNSRDSWQVPSYFLFDFSAGYKFKIQKEKFQLRMKVENLFNTAYISTAQNNDTHNGQIFNEFNGRSAAVFFGTGRSFVTSLQYDF